MLDLRNRTPFQAQLFPALTREGEELCLVIVKGTFTFDRSGVQPAGEQQPLAVADVHYGEPATTSAKYEADTSPPKPGTDVVLVGQAHSDRPVAELDVGLGGGPVFRQASHQVDIVRYIAGGRVKSVRAQVVQLDASRHAPMPAAMKLLVVEDDAVTRRAVVRAIKKAEENVEVVEEADGQAVQGVLNPMHRRAGTGQVARFEGPLELLARVPEAGQEHAVLLAEIRHGVSV